MREQGFEACCNGLFLRDFPVGLTPKQETKWKEGWRAAFYASYFNSNRKVA